MHPEEPGGCQAINSHTPVSESIRKRAKKYPKADEGGELSLFCLPEDDESICLALHLKATLNFRSFFILVLRKSDFVCVVNLLSSGSAGEEHDYGDLSFPYLMAFDR